MDVRPITFTVDPSAPDPTETVYGLGANALDPRAVASIFEAKGRPASNPVIAHVADPADARTLAADWPHAAAVLAQRFWPGPLTLVLPKRATVPDVLTAGGPTVAVRCPAHPVARALIAAAGVPVAAPSANRSTELSPTRAEHVRKSLDGRIDMILNGGPCPGGIESTVVDVTADPVRLLRPGLVSATELVAVLGQPVAVGPAADGVAKSPGQMAKHYSPRTPVVLVSTDEVEALGRNTRHYGLIWWSPQPELSEAVGYPAGQVCRVFGLPADPERASALLYDTLHKLDLSNLELILVEMPPDTPEWAGVRDRLIRAAAT